MKKKNRLNIFSVFAVIVAIGLVTFVFNAKAALTSDRKPYEYDFKESASVYNSFTGAKELEITFDKNIADGDLTTQYAGKIDVFQLVDGAPQSLPIIRTAVASGNKLTITFKNLEYVDYSKGMQFKVVISRGALYFDQLTDYEFPFEFHDLLPGFKSVFATPGKTELINTNIFKNNAPRDVILYLPKLHINKIETIHRRNGVTEEETNNPALTNIDVLTDPAATRLKVKFDGSSQHDRDLDRRTDLQGFSMGQAGIDAMICTDSKEGKVCNSAGREFALSAFDQFGRKLTERSFKVKVKPTAEGSTPSKNEFTMNDYIKTPDKAFGQQKTLYDVMSDAKLSKSVFEQLPVSEYNKIGVIYSLGDTISVYNEEQLIMALEHPGFKTIKIEGSMDLNGLPNDTLTIDRSITLEGKGQVANTFIGNVVLGKGQDIEVRLRNMKIDGNLTVDVGDNGTAILEDTTVTGTTTITSGGSNSIYLYGFTSPYGLALENRNPVRIVNSDTVKKLDVQLSGTGEVTLEGEYREVTLFQGAHLNFKGTTKIGVLKTAPGVAATDIIFTGSGGSVEINETGKELPSSAPGEMEVVELLYPSALISNASDWSTLGVQLYFDTLMDSATVSSITNWQLVGNEFASEINVRIDTIGNLFIEGLPLEEATKNIVIEGSVANKTYRITMPITVEN
ncbi:hypothetical protein [Sporosarcina sp. SAFN-015]|uniref:hypothetical protein n=1 Tax=Sporosarcina sp. SAFN-015 TaxID=3387274 RepID=UPI003F8118B6